MPPTIPFDLRSFAYDCLLLGSLLYDLGSGSKADPSLGFPRAVLQRIGAGFLFEGLLLLMLFHLDLNSQNGPPLWATVLIGALMIIGVPALVSWQVQRAQALAAGFGGSRSSCDSAALRRLLSP